MLVLVDCLGDVDMLNVLFGIWILARLHVAATALLSALGIKIEADASAKRFSNVDRTFDSLVSTAAAEANIGLKAASNVNDVPRIMVDCEWCLEVKSMKREC